MAVLGTVFGSWATDYAYTLVVNLTNGDKVSYLFENSPFAMIEGDDLKITEVATMQEVVFPISDLINMTFEREEIPDGIKPLLDAGKVAFGLTRSTLDAYGLEPGTELFIYDADGKLMIAGNSGSSREASLDISSLEKGVYVVKAGNYSFKFIR